MMSSAPRLLPIAGCLLLSAAVLSPPQPLGAQSLSATGGLGTPVRPLDGRSQVLGLGVGLFGLNPSLVNPAELAGTLGRGVSVSMQPTARRVQLGGLEDRVEATRFPLIRVAYPVRERTVLSLGYGSFLDQTVTVISEDTVMVGGEPMPVRDRIASSGGIAQLRLGASYELRPELALGAAIGLYTGGVDRSIVRTFPGEGQEDLEPFVSERRWSYGAPLAAAGFRWDPAPAVRLGGAVAIGGDLRAKPEEGGEERHFSTPLQVDVGGSAFVSRELMVAASGRWAGWETAAATEASRAHAAGDEWTLAGGIEWGGIGAGTGRFPLRAGARYGRLPFHVGGDAFEGERPSEWAAGFGFGIRLAIQDERPAALFDAGFERGSLTAGGSDGLSETFWRATLSLSLFGR